MLSWIPLLLPVPTSQQVSSSQWQHPPAEPRLTPAQRCKQEQRVKKEREAKQGRATVGAACAQSKYTVCPHFT